MKVKIVYSKMALDCAVDFVAKKNKMFLNKKDYIRDKILECMKTLAKDSELTTVGTLGFLLTADFEPEGLDNDENICRIDIYVSPDLGEIDPYEDYIEEIIDAPTPKQS